MDRRDGVNRRDLLKMIPGAAVALVGLGRFKPEMTATESMPTEATWVDDTEDKRKESGGHKIIRGRGIYYLGDGRINDEQT